METENFIQSKPQYFISLFCWIWGLNRDSFKCHKIENWNQACDSNHGPGTKTASDCMFKLTRINRIKHFLDQSTLVYLKHASVFANYFTVELFGAKTAKKILENFI